MLRLSTQISANAAPANKSDTPTSPNNVLATRSETPTWPNIAPATKSDTVTVPAVTSDQNLRSQATPRPCKTLKALEHWHVDTMEMVSKIEDWQGSARAHFGNQYPTKDIRQYRWVCLSRSASRVWPLDREPLACLRAVPASASPKPRKNYSVSCGKRISFHFISFHLDLQSGFCLHSDWATQTLQ